MEAGNLSNVSGVGSGVLACRINVGPGYKVFFSRDGDTLNILLGGRHNGPPTEDACEFWQGYRRCKQKEV